ncbi:GNAT family N-acetyltransferase, partial [Salmonella sp. M265]|uniref:GNAT family N-acetyltransferase n=1 Tax=Salmonella sp. M265 TaxID=3240301 RepID=UPI00352AD61A
VFQACHLGFSLAAAAQGRGLMARALRVANRYCFEQLGLHRIMASHLPRNARSERLLESLEWKREEVDALIVVTQSPDYLAPATAII